jgi:hypothetical protein
VPGACPPWPPALRCAEPGSQSPASAHPIVLNIYDEVVPFLRRWLTIKRTRYCSARSISPRRPIRIPRSSPVMLSTMGGSCPSSASSGCEAPRLRLVCLCGSGSHSRNACPAFWRRLVRRDIWYTGFQRFSLGFRAQAPLSGLGTGLGQFAPRAPAPRLSPAAGAAVKDGGAGAGQSRLVWATGLSPRVGRGRSLRLTPDLDCLRSRPQCPPGRAGPATSPSRCGWRRLRSYRLRRRFFFRLLLPLVIPF